MIFETLSPSEFTSEVSEENSILIDIRTPEEYVQFWVLPNVDLFMNMHDSDFAEKLWRLDKKTHYLIYCWHASRTKHVMEYMKNIWFEYVKDLDGWIDKWCKEWFEISN